MAFTDRAFLVFLPVVFGLYWLVRYKTPQNLLLLAASYVFYGYIHPWFCILIAASTLVDFACGWLMETHAAHPWRRKLLLALSIAANLGMLAAFKYYNFFVGNVEQLFTAVGLRVEPALLQVILPAGISFYTFQTLSYTIDVYRKQMQACRNPIDFAVFVSCFPQLVAGPIERASRLLPQIESPRVWNWERFLSAIPLLVVGFFKKLVVADNLAGWVQQVYMLETPSLYVLLAGTVAFAMQILADFSAYTDIARGCSRLLGIELQENFRSPYLAISPSDFWRRWHISLSSWIRDYLYVPLGGSKVESRWRHAWILIVTFSLSGLWHGAQWHFVMWGLYNGLLLVAYHMLGMGGKWRPAKWWQLIPAWCVMMMFTLVGWSLFRAGSLAWLGHAVAHGGWGISGDDLYVGTLILGYCLVYGLGWMLFRATAQLRSQMYWSNVMCHWALFGFILLLANRDPEAFIYFQF